LVFDLGVISFIVNSSKSRTSGYYMGGRKPAFAELDAP